jgi:hypothetical protein
MAARMLRKLAAMTMWQGFFEAWGIIAVVCSLVAFALFVLKRTMPGGLERKKARSEPIFRRIVEREIDPSGDLITLECGHQVHLIFRQPTQFRCDICTQEVKDLKKMAGEK